MGYPQMAGVQDVYSPSLKLWSNSVAHQRSEAELIGLGTLWYDDFTKLSTGDYTATQATAGTFALDDAVNGVALADCNSTTQGQGINVQRGAEAFKPAAGRNIYFEGRVKAADIATGPEFFFGLAVTDTTIIATQALSAQAIGFKSVTNDGILLATCKDGSSETTDSSIHTFVDDAWVKLGFKVTGVTKVEFYVDGDLVGTVTANIPTTELKPSLVCQTGGTTDPIIHIDWGKAWADR